MAVIVLVIVLGIFIVCAARRVHSNNVKKLNAYDGFVSEERLDSELASIIDGYHAAQTPHYDFVFKTTDMPYGRANAFLNFFGKSIYTEEPYLFLCKRSSLDDEFREYGCIFGRTGVYFSTEYKDNKKTSHSVDKYISFYGLSQIWKIGSLVCTVNVQPDSFLDKVNFYSLDNETGSLVVQLGKTVIGNQYGYALYNHNIGDNESLPSDLENGVVYNYDIKNEDAINAKNEEAIEEEFIKTENKQYGEGFQKGFQAAGVQAAQPRFQAFWGEIKHLMDGSRGHGYAAEYGNNAADRLSGKKVEYAAQQLDEHGRQVKHGADRIVNGTEIQTKYYKTASETIGAAFEKKQAIYLRSDGSGKMMQIEVPRDQYQDALKAMQKRIDSGQVPNVSPGENASNYVRKGFFTYEQSFNVAKAGTIESISVDAVSGAVCCLGAVGISSILIFSQAIWRGESPKQAIKESISTSLTIMGKGTLIYTLTMQLSRKEVANILAGKVFTVDGISQGYKTFSNPAYVLSENMAKKISASSFAKGGIGQTLGLDKMTGRQLIGNSVTIAVVFGPDVVRAIQGRISTKQLFKNATVGAAGMAGAAIGQAVIPIPIVGAITGGAIGGIAAKKTMDVLIEDDAKEMFRILKEEFIDQTMLANLSSKEFDEAVNLTVANKKASKFLQDMFKSKDYRNYARDEIMRPAIVSVISKRNTITQDEYDDALIEMAEASLA